MNRAQNKTASATNNASPLDTLNAALGTDMRDTNTIIITKMDSPVKLIPQLAAYLIAAGGKRVRPLLTLAATAIYNGDMSRAHALSACVEFIHTATLLHDDVVDESTQRRGQDAANLVFGNQASVLVGDFLFSRAFQLMTEDGNLDILRILSEASAVIAEGEVLQLTTANNLDTTMADYVQVITSKTAALFAAACEVGPVIASADSAQQKAMRDYGMNIGIAFQIADDILDYSASREALGKTIGDDFREGKMTAPLLFALEKADASEKKFWQRTISERNQNDDDLQTAMDIFIRHDVMNISRIMAQKYAENAIDALNYVPQHTFTDTLKSLANYTVTRKT